MKKLLLILMGFMFFSLISSAEIRRDFIALLHNYDVIELLPKESDGSALTFWNNIVFENNYYKKRMNKVMSKGGSAKSARMEIARINQKNEPILNSLSLYSSMLDSMKYDIIGNCSFADSISIRYFDDDDINAMCTTEPNVYIFKGLLDLIFEKSEHPIWCMYAVLGHEFTHGLFHHMFFSLYNKYKNEKRDELFAELAVGMASFNYAYSHARGTEGIIKSQEQINKIGENVYSEASLLSSLSYYRYNREQEYQSDIVSFRLLDWLGIGGEYVIEMLQLLKRPYEVSSEDFDDHPSIQDRIKLLKFMQTRKRIVYNENQGDKVIRKRWQKGQGPDTE